MKKIIMITAIILGLSFPAFADMHICDFTAQIAEKMMTLRQNNGDLMSVSTAMREVELPKELSDLVQLIIRNAWEHSRFSTEKNQQNAIQDFKNKLYLECIKIHPIK